MPAVIVATTERLAVSMTDTDGAPVSNMLEFATYARVPVGFTATPNGCTPTPMCAGGVVSTVVPSMTVTLLPFRFEMYANGSAPAPEAVSSRASATSAVSIPETPFVPENPLGSGHVVFMTSDECSGDATDEKRDGSSGYARS